MSEALKIPDPRIPDGMDREENYIPFADGYDLIAGPDTISIANMYTLCKNQTVPAKKSGKDWLLYFPFLEECLKWRDQTVSFAELADSLIQEYGIEKITPFKRALRENVRPFILSEHPTVFTAARIAKDDTDVMKKARTYAERYTPKDSNLITMDEAAEKAGTSKYILQQIVKEEGIERAEHSAGVPTVRKLVSWTDLNAFLVKRNSFIGIYDFLDSILPGIKTTFDIENPSQRGQFYTKMRAHDTREEFLSWEESHFHTDRRNAFYFPQRLRPEMYERAKNFLEHYGTSDNRLEHLMKERYWHDNPNTQKIFLEFKRNKAVDRIASLAELLVNNLNKEIQECSDEEIAVVLAVARSKPFATYEEVWCKFVNYVRDRYQTMYTVDLIRKTMTTGVSNNSNEPYTLSQYFSLAFMTLNEYGIRTYNLVRKSLEDPQCAYIWVRILWTYCCAWRLSDFCTIPYIPLPYDVKETERRILAGEFDEDAKKMAIRLISACNDRYTLPHKTMDVQSSSFRLVSIPASSYVVYGTAYTILRMHFPGNLPKLQLRPYDYIRIFGQDYRRIFGESAHSIRRANKSFLTTLDERVQKTDGAAGRISGYMVAALARGHHAAAGQLPETTSIYLRTRMDGLQSDEVLKLLFEAGTCSFVPLMMMQAVYGNDFSVLDIKDQTKIIEKAGKDALAVDSEAACIRREYLRADRVTKDLYAVHTDVKHLLMDIATHRCVSKEPDIQCLMTGTGHSCPFESRQSCFGCPYAVMENAFLFRAFRKIQEMMERINKAKLPADQERLAHVLKECYLPPFIAALGILKNTYGIDVAEYQEKLVNVLEGGSDHGCID